jgi:DNA recombination protein RmuC
MISTQVVLAFVLGTTLGLVVAMLLKRFNRNSAEEIASKLLGDAESKRQEQLAAVTASMKDSFGNLSLDALNKSTEQFLKLAQQSFEAERKVNNKELEGKKGLIDNELKRVSTELDSVTKVIQKLEQDRAEKFGTLSAELKRTNAQTSDLMQVTQQLNLVLSSTKLRGQWGERMAEDVLNLAGLTEKINYLKNRSSDGGKSRPDFTFLLPRELKLNMDVKFPLDNYVRFVQSDSESDQQKFKSDFLKDVRARMKEVTSRDYIDPSNNTLDYVLLFIPNEQIYAFIHDQDQTLLENALQKKVVMCSPITLFAVLAVIRQSVDNFALEKTSNEILSLLGQFKKQWHQFVGKLEIMGKRISDAQKEYDTLTSTRRRQLEKPLDKIEEIRTQRGLPVSGEEVEQLSGETDQAVRQIDSIS